MVLAEMNSLEGKVLAITRSEDNANEFVRLVTAGGGTAIALKTIEVIPNVHESIRLISELRASPQDFCAFMSAQAVQVLFSSAENLEVRQILARTNVIAIGPATKKMLEEHDVRVDHVPVEYSTSGMVKMLANLNPFGKKIVLPRSAAANDDFSESLRSLGMIVKEVPLYTVKTSEPSDEWNDFILRLQKRKVDAIVFTSASNVVAFFEILGRLLPQQAELHTLARVISIGPYTTRELRKRKVDAFEAQAHTIAGTVELAKRILM